MKKSTKKVLIATGVVAAILLFPVTIQQRTDGGTVTYKAILYSVTDWHEMTGLDSDDGKTTYVEGLSIEILGIEVFDNRSLVSH